MATLQKVMKQMKSGHWLMVAVVVILVLGLYNYSSGKGLARDGMGTGAVNAVMAAEQQMMGEVVGGAGAPSGAAEKEHGDFAPASGIQTSQHGMSGADSAKMSLNATELLPKDVNGAWAQVPPHGLNELSNVNMMASASLLGKVSVNKNPSYDIREPPKVEATLQNTPFLMSSYATHEDNHVQRPSLGI
jgi:hypothetical protein